MKLRSPLTIIVATAAVTVTLVFMVMNLSLGDKQVDWRPKHPYAIADPQFVRTMSVMLGPPLTGGNRVEALLNGDQIFPAMREAIRAAKDTVTFETYIYWSKRPWTLRWSARSSEMASCGALRRFLF